MSRRKGRRPDEARPWRPAPGQSTLWIYCDGRKPGLHRVVSVARLWLDDDGLLRVGSTPGPITHNIVTLADGTMLTDATVQNREIIEADSAQGSHRTITLRCHRCDLDLPVRVPALEQDVKKLITAGVSRAALRLLTP